jgi:hypothetical protein
MASLTVTATHRYSSETLSNITEIDFSASVRVGSLGGQLRERIP